MKIYIDEKNKEVINKAIDEDMSVLLIGQSGTGKTSIISELAKERKTDLYRVNLTGQTSVDDLIGRYAINEKGTFWIDGLLVRAMREGKWIVLDEINMALADILSKIHSLLDHEKKLVLNEKDGEVVVPHADFRLFATMNPSDDYAGTKELNMAFISRFGIVSWFDYANNEADILVEQGGVDIDTASLLTLLAKEVRKNKDDSKLSYMLTTRDLIYCSRLIKSGINPSIAVENAILNKYPSDERVAVSKLFSLISDNQINVETETGKESFASIEDMQEQYKTMSASIKELKDKNTDLESQVKKSNDSRTELETAIIEVISDDEITDMQKVKSKLESVLVEKLL